MATALNLATKPTATADDVRFGRVLGRGRGLGEHPRETPRPPVGATASGHLPIFFYLDISNAHLSEEEEAILHSGVEAGKGDDELLPRHIPHKYGAWMNVPEESDDENGAVRSQFYPNIQAVIEFARLHGCSWVNFDVDASSIAELPTF